MDIYIVEAPSTRCPWISAVAAAAVGIPNNMPADRPSSPARCALYQPQGSGYIGLHGTRQAQQEAADAGWRGMVL